MRSQIITNRDIIEQINTFTEPGSSVSYKNEKDVAVKISKFLQVTRFINKYLRPSQFQKHTLDVSWIRAS